MGVTSSTSSTNSISSQTPGIASTSETRQSDSESKNPNLEICLNGISDSKTKFTEPSSSSTIASPVPTSSPLTSTFSTIPTSQTSKTHATIFGEYKMQDIIKLLTSELTSKLTFGLEEFFITNMEANQDMSVRLNFIFALSRSLKLTTRAKRKILKCALDNQELGCTYGRRNYQNCIYKESDSDYKYWQLIMNKDEIDDGVFWGIIFQNPEILLEWYICYYQRSPERGTAPVTPNDSERGTAPVTPNDPERGTAPVTPNDSERGSTASAVAIPLVTPGPDIEREYEEKKKLPINEEKQTYLISKEQAAIMYECLFNTYPPKVLLKSVECWKRLDWSNNKAIKWTNQVM